MIMKIIRENILTISIYLFFLFMTKMPHALAHCPKFLDMLMNKIASLDHKNVIHYCKFLKILI
jgi:hypothetical protein